MFTRNDIRAAYNFSKSGHIVGKIAVVPAPIQHSGECAASLECTSERSTIVPVPDSLGSKFPCYEGTPGDIYEACTWDILRRPFAKDVRCGTCAEAGYGKHISKDPIFRKIDLWTKSHEIVV